MESYAKFGELDGARAVHVNLVDHVLDLGVGRVLSQRPHHGRQLLKERGTFRFIGRCKESPVTFSNYSF